MRRFGHAMLLFLLFAPGSVFMPRAEAAAREPEVILQEAMSSRISDRRALELFHELKDSIRGKPVTHSININVLNVLTFHPKERQKLIQIYAEAVQVSREGLKPWIIPAIAAASVTGDYGYIGAANSGREYTGILRHLQTQPHLSETILANIREGKQAENLSLIGHSYKSTLLQAMKQIDPHSDEFPSLLGEAYSLELHRDAGIEPLIAQKFHALEAKPDEVYFRVLATRPKVRKYANRETLFKAIDARADFALETEDQMKVLDSLAPFAEEEMEKVHAFVSKGRVSALVLEKKDRYPNLAEEAQRIRAAHEDALLNHLAMKNGDLSASDMREVLEEIKQNPTDPDHLKNLKQILARKVLNEDDLFLLHEALGVAIGHDLSSPAMLNSVLEHKRNLLNYAKFILDDGRMGSDSAKMMASLASLGGTGDLESISYVINHYLENALKDPKIPSEMKTRILDTLSETIAQVSGHGALTGMGLTVIESHLEMASHLPYSKASSQHFLKVLRENSGLSFYMADHPSYVDWVRKRGQSEKALHQYEWGESLGMLSTAERDPVVKKKFFATAAKMGEVEAALQYFQKHSAELLHDPGVSKELTRLLAAEPKLFEAAAYLQPELLKELPFQPGERLEKMRKLTGRIDALANHGRVTGNYRVSLTVPEGWPAQPQKGLEQVFAKLDEDDRIKAVRQQFDERTRKERLRDVVEADFQSEKARVAHQGEVIESDPFAKQLGLTAPKIAPSLLESCFLIPVRNVFRKPEHLN